MKSYIENNRELLYELLEALCKIPAPSHFEDERARFCRDWLTAQGACGVYIDEAKNVVFPYECEGSRDITVICAHTDTVFPDTEPMPYVDDGECIRCPGVGDDTASLAVMLLVAKYFVEKGIRTKGGILFVANSCEEGLGNLKGTRRICRDFEGRIKSFVSFDSNIDVIHKTCVGSVRYEVEAKTEGGHSFGKFGNKNAIAELADIVGKIYSITPPQREGTKTTYNVGTISGGTSVNTIAQSAVMLCEFRSDCRESMDFMKQKFEEIFDSQRSDKTEILVKVVGERPTASPSLDLARLDSLASLCASVIESNTGKPVIYRPASTDCNIPQSQGVPGVAVGVYYGGGAHTREEWIYKDSLIPGLKIAIELALRLASFE